MDVWSKTYFPANVALWLLVTTISRQVNPLNFPLSPLDTAHGMSSEIISMRRRDGTVRYTGWFRTLGTEQLVLYTGFYMTESPPVAGTPCAKVVFPMPNGNATVILRPRIGADGALVLDSSGGRSETPVSIVCKRAGATGSASGTSRLSRSVFRCTSTSEGSCAAIIRCDSLSCESGQCIPGTCAGTTVGETCLNDLDCSGRCADDNSFCTEPSQCAIGSCSGSGLSCSSETQCASTEDCIFPVQCVPGDCIGDPVCTAPRFTVDYCEDALDQLPGI